MTTRETTDLRPGYFEVCYPRTGARYGVHARSGLALTLGPDCVEHDGWNRPNDWMSPWMWSTRDPRPRAWTTGGRNDR